MTNIFTLSIFMNILSTNKSYITFYTSFNYAESRLFAVTLKWLYCFLVYSYFYTVFLLVINIKKKTEIHDLYKIIYIVQNKTDIIYKHSLQKVL